MVCPNIQTICPSKLTICPNFRRFEPIGGATAPPAPPPPTAMMWTILKTWFCTKIMVDLFGNVITKEYCKIFAGKIQASALNTVSVCKKCRSHKSAEKRKKNTENQRNMLKTNSNITIIYNYEITVKG